ncbi:MAG: 4-hydroxythreonine-4-phosphate dehydrogenase PdxA [Bacteroidales bacterium]|nr:4-hydroxythreonine-4-phosphate dehydrogenase PdxA [Bacteroidales bacterium]MCI5482524.1 4-hydroxythreonine-4-phosphate dehydrogenase PdxA [Bacteroidales bacterium]MDD6751007.1 4-hydroxythreonine-4-phosphate dehydrogenase PdxA [Bacteroidales bacterium]MDY2878084.1 4-hydroxythreonine-4-phosphate dehydrogenase PdxA [Candidatus Cryptobacteroides sp.]
MSKILVGITQGDSNGIGYEVIIKALSDPRILEQFTPVIYGSSKIFSFYRKTIPEIEQMDTNAINNAREAHPKRVNIVNCLPDSAYAEPGQATPESAKAAIACLDRAVEDLKAGEIDVLVTGPINKKAMSGQGFGFPGHTEYIQNAFGVKDVTMLMVSSRIKVGVVTGHIPLKDVAASITEEKILSKLRLINESLQKDFCIDKPRIAVLSLNPHSGDGGLLGDEEGRIIIPAIKKAVDEGILAFGPFSPDGFFGLSHYENFDATLAMYHDQGLAPFKALSFEDGVNFTAGLPVVRTSPDHGTAFEMAGRDEADPLSMRAAIFTAIDIFRKREQFRQLQENKMPERSLGEERPQRSDRPQIA